MDLWLEASVGDNAAFDLPQLAVRAMKDGVCERERWSRPIKGVPSEPLKEEPEPETQRYLVDTVCDRKRWKREIVEPWLIHTKSTGASL